MSAGLLVEQLRGGGAASLPLPHQARHYRVCCFRQGRTVRNWVRRRNLDPRLRTSRTSSAVSSRRTVASCRRCAEHQKGWEATLIGLWWCIACQQGKRRRWRKNIAGPEKRLNTNLPSLHIPYCGIAESPQGSKKFGQFWAITQMRDIHKKHLWKHTNDLGKKPHLSVQDKKYWSHWAYYVL